ncbi:MAG: hypothetical protein LQ337_000769 [Flavoplaca oasis]|nr:MAG: hypothetical protein LQ337_000769 [Flavoplaca oasis]
MAQGRMSWCTKEEDRLIRRGANPRTGLISPFISDGIGDNSAGNDYVKVRDVLQDCGPMSNAQGRVSAIFCPSRPSDTRASGGLGSPIRRRKLPLTDTVTHQSPPMPPNSLFEIPRKPVGGQRALSTPTAVPHSGTEQLFRHLKRLPGSGKYTNGAPSLARLDAENVALGFHADPSTASKCRSTKYDQTRSEPILQPFSKYKAHKPNTTRIQSCAINDDVASIDPIVPHQRPRTPDLGKAYRRPKMLLPGHLRCPSVPHVNTPMLHENARISTSHANYQTSADAISVQRPKLRRLSASTVVHQFDIARGKATSALINRLGLSPMSQEGDVCGHCGSSFESPSRPRGTPIQLGGSTFVSREAFYSSMGHDSHSDTDTKPPFQHGVKQPPPLLSLNGVLLPDQEIPANDCRIRSKAPRNIATAVDNYGISLDQTSVARRSTNGTNKIWISCLAAARETVASIDFGLVQRQLLKAMKHGTLAVHRSPSAIRILLLSHDADVKTYLSAAWCMMVTLSHLVIFLSVFAAGFRTLELLVEIVHCIWYPFGVLLNVVRWVLTT